MTSLEVLLCVRSLLAKPEAWTKGAYARNCDADKVSLTHPHACRFSITGAFHRVQYITGARCGPAFDLVRHLVWRDASYPLDTFNDAEGTTHSAILLVIDKAIRRLGGTPPEQEEEQC